MTIAYLIQTAASAVAILALAALAWKFGVGRHPTALSEAEARAIMAEELPSMAIGRIWLAADGRAALARSGDEALILYAVGDGHIARTAPWTSLAASQVKKGRVLVALADRSAPRASFTIGDGGAWPPVLGV